MSKPTDEQIRKVLSLAKQLDQIETERSRLFQESVKAKKEGNNQLYRECRDKYWGMTTGSSKVKTLLNDAIWDLDNEYPLSAIKIGDIVYLKDEYKSILRIDLREVPTIDPDSGEISGLPT